MSYCDECLHIKVCGSEEVDDESIKFCADRLLPDKDCISRESAEMCLTGNITGMTIEQYISMVADRLKSLPGVQPISKSVIEDIKDEIKALPRIYPFVDSYIKEKDVIKIIDKHIAERKNHKNENIRIR